MSLWVALHPRAAAAGKASALLSPVLPAERQEVHAVCKKQAVKRTFEVNFLAYWIPPPFNMKLNVFF